MNSLVLKQLYKLTSIIIFLFSVWLAIEAAVDFRNQNISTLMQLPIISIIISLITFWRFLFGNKKGHLILFSYLIISLVVAFSAYVDIEYNNLLGVTLALNILIALTSILLAFILRETKDIDYFKKYFSGHNLSI